MAAAWLRRPVGRRVGFFIAALLAAGMALWPVLRWYPLIPLQAWISHPVASWRLAQGINPHPVRLVRPPAAPLSAMAQLGKLIFFDPSLSGSGSLSCASCHAPAQAYGPPGGAPVARGGPNLRSSGLRAVPSLMYLERQPPFSIGPDNAEDETATLGQEVVRGLSTARSTKRANDTAAAAGNLVPQGGMFWDGRADTLQQQANGPLFSRFEMDAGTPDRVAAILADAPYAYRFRQLFGPNIFRQPSLAVAEALSALARYQIEDRSFHPYNSRYDAWLEGKARLTPLQLRGYLLFNDPAYGNCAACHLDRLSADGLPPLFTDHQYEALGVPRNPTIPANRDPGYYDLGLCGPLRKDLTGDRAYCGLFQTPTLRNVATRKVFFHNGVYHSLADVLRFYALRDTQPGAIYPRAAAGGIDKFNDLPKRYQSNVDRVDAPLNRHAGQAPALSAANRHAIVAFLHTLTDR